MAIVRELGGTFAGIRERMSGFFTGGAPAATTASLPGGEVGSVALAPGLVLHRRDYRPCHEGLWAQVSR